jgi:hypothetical protein
LPGTQVETELPIRCDRGCLRRDALTADHLDGIGSGAVQDDRQVAARAVQMRFHHLEREAGRDGGVERIAAAFQDGHAGRRGQPVRRCHHSERAENLGAGGEAGHDRAPPLAVTPAVRGM